MMTEATTYEQRRLMALGFTRRPGGIPGFENAPPKSYKIVFGATEYTLAKDSAGHSWQTMGTTNLQHLGYREI